MTVERIANKNELYERYWLICSFVGSVICHCFAFAVVFYSLTLYPVVALTSSREVLWFYPSLLFGSSAESEDNPDHNPVQNESSAQKNVSPPPVQQQAVPDRSEPPEIDLPVHHNDISIESKPPEPVPEEVEEVLTVASLPVPLPVKKTVKPEIRTPVIRKEPMASSKAVTTNRQPSKEASSAAVVKQHSVEPAKPTDLPVSDMADAAFHPAPETSPPQVISIMRGKAIQSAQFIPKMEQPGRDASAAIASAGIKNSSDVSRPAAFSLKKEINTTRAKASGNATGSEAGQGIKAIASIKSAQAPKPASVEKTPGASGTRVSGYVSGESMKQSAKTVIAQAQIQPARTVSGEVADKKASGVSAQPKGLFTPPITGDIKFELVAREDMRRGVKVKVGFLDYPRSRRGRPQSRYEAKQVKSITPMVVTPKENAIHAIIDHASEGIYYLRLDLERDQISDVSITIRIFEGTPRAAKKTIHLHGITGHETVVRLLMPEGVVWEDPTAFSGSLEDSDSVTKFNSETGIEWKEYH